MSDIPTPALNIAEQNRQLTERVGWISEYISVRPLTRESAGKLGEAMAKRPIKGKYRAKISQANVRNQNGRIYSSALWGRQIERSHQKIANGTLAGAVDHKDPTDEMASTCIKWNELFMDGAGAVYGDYDIVQDHSKGKDLKALHDAGLGIGFSTTGVGSAHLPTDAEKQLYGLSDEDAANTVIIDDEAYDLRGIDSVRGPSVIDAYRQKENASDASVLERDDLQTNPETKPMLTLDDLKAAHPEIFALHCAAVESAGKTAVTEATKPLNDQITDLTNKLGESKKFETYFNAFTEGLKPFTSVSLPEREVADAEHVAKVEAAQSAEKSAKDELAKLVKSHGELQAQVDAEKAKVENEKRKSAVAEKLNAVLKDNRFAKAIQLEIDNGKMVDAPEFTAEKAEAFVKARNECYEAAHPSVNPADEDQMGIVEPVAPAVKPGEKQISAKAKEIRKSMRLNARG